MTDVEQISPGTFKYEKKPVFVRWPIGEHGKWHVWGPESELVKGSVAEIFQYSTSETIPVEVIDYVAERMVLRRRGDRVRFVLATFDKVIDEQ